MVREVCRNVHRSARVVSARRRPLVKEVNQLAALHSLPASLAGNFGGRPNVAAACQIAWHRFSNFCQ